MANLDAYIGSGHNYYIYDDSVTHKFNWINWDVNEAFGNFNMGMSLAALQNLSIFFIASPASSRPLYQKMLADTAYKSAYVSAYCSILNSFSNVLWNGKIDSIKNMIKDEVNGDPNKFFTYQQFLDNIEMDIDVPGTPGGSAIAGLKTFITTRRNFLLTELAAQGCGTLTTPEVNNLPAIALFPNPASEYLTVTFSSGINEIELYNGQGTCIKTQLTKSVNEVNLNISDLPVGFYFLLINHIENGRFIIVR
jgi:hypothetical protein